MALIDKINDGFRQLTILVKGKVDKTAIIDVAYGGTGATTLTAAQTALGVDKVVSANTRLTTAKQTFPNVYVDSNGQLQKTQFATWLDHAKMYNGLFPNGSFQMGDGTGWKLETSGLLSYDTTDFPFGAQGCLRCIGQASGTTTLILDKLPVNPYMPYRISAMFKYEKYATTGNLYAGLACYDVDGNQIAYGNAYFTPNTVTTLAQDLKVGDTKVYVTSLANWDYTKNQGINFYNYTDSKGYLYDPSVMPYTRYQAYLIWDTTTSSSIDTTNNIINLKSAWSYRNPKDPDGIWRAGTKIAQAPQGGGANVWNLRSGWMNGQTGITQWTYATANIGGISMAYADDLTKFRAGTAYVAPVFWFNYLSQPSNANDITKVSNLYFEKI